MKTIVQIYRADNDAPDPRDIIRNRHPPFYKFRREIGRRYALVDPPRHGLAMKNRDALEAENKAPPPFELGKVVFYHGEETLQSVKQLRDHVTEPLNNPASREQLQDVNAKVWYGG